MKLQIVITETEILVLCLTFLVVGIVRELVSIWVIVHHDREFLGRTEAAFFGSRRPPPSAF
jgi:hypothetical protein